jgi:TolA-binding protein
VEALVIVLAFVLGVAVGVVLMAAAWKAVARADEGKAPTSIPGSVVHAIEVIAQAIGRVLTLQKQQNEGQEEMQNRLERIRAALAGLIARDAERTEREHALLEAFGHVKAEVDELKAKLSGVDPELDAQLADLSAALDAETANVGAATAEVEAALAPAEETTVDVAPAIEPAPEASAPAEAPVAPTEG